MARTIFKAKVKELNSLTKTMRELVLEMSEPSTFEFKAGQFINIKIPQPGAPLPLQRAYSLASDDRNHSSFKLLVKLVESGVGSDFVKTLSIGSEVDFIGPFGKTFFAEPPAKQVLFICTGAGLSQHMSFMLSNMEKYPKNDFYCMIGVWNESEIFYEAQLEELKQKNSKFDFNFVVNSPEGENYTGPTGYVTDHIGPFRVKEIDTQIYLCGNPAMIDGVKKKLTELKFPDNKIFVESFG